MTRVTPQSLDVIMS